MNIRLIYLGFSFLWVILNCSYSAPATQLLNIKRVAASNPAGKSVIYYVAKTGNDQNPGTSSLPFLTIQKVSNVVSAGDIVYIRAGVYQESVNFAKSGTEKSHIQILAYPSENPIIDGNNYTIPNGEYSPLLTASGNYIEIRGIEIRYSHGMGLVLSGKGDLADKIYSHHNMQNGILITGDYSTVQNSTVYSNCMNNSGGTARANASGLSAARKPNFASIKNNVVYENWGEGLSTFEANGTLIEGNVVYDNWATNIYISDATNIILQRNFVYQTKDMSHGSQVGILLGDEKYTPPSYNIKILNNIAYGCKRNLYWFQGTKGGGMNTVLIANNTFVNSTYFACVQFAQGTHIGVKFQNNVVVENGLLPIHLVSNSELHFSNNLWSRKPSLAASGIGDVIGDPKFADVTHPFIAASYKLSDSSPAIKAGANVGLNCDYLGNAIVGIPDIGAFEYNSDKSR